MEFISSLLFNVAKNTLRPLFSQVFLSNPMKIFDAVASSPNRGFLVAPGLTHSGQSMGGLGRENASVLFYSFHPDMGDTGLAEILHQAGAETYTDQELAWAGYETAWAQGYHVPPPPHTNDVYDNSKYFHNTLQFRACSPNQQKR
jgi:hypothetical protein